MARKPKSTKPSKPKPRKPRKQTQQQKLRKTKTYQKYMRERRRVQSLIYRARRKGEDVADSYSIIGAIPTNLSDLRSATRNLRQIHSINSIVEISTELLGNTIDRLPTPMPVETTPNIQLPSWQDIVVQSFYDTVVTTQHGSKPVNPLIQAKWDVTDLNDLMEQLLEEALSTYGKNTLAQAIQQVQEQQFLDPWTTAWDYDTRHKLAFIQNLLDQLSTIDQTQNNSTLYDLLITMRNVIDEGYLDDFR